MRLAHATTLANIGLVCASVLLVGLLQGLLVVNEISVLSSGYNKMFNAMSTIRPSGNFFL